MKHETLPSKIGQRVRQIRKESGLKPAIFAAKLNMSRQMLYFIEGGKRGLTVERLQLLKQRFNVNIDELLGRQQRRSA